MESVGRHELLSAICAFWAELQYSIETLVLRTELSTRNRELCTQNLRQESLVLRIGSSALIKESFL